MADEQLEALTMLWRDEHISYAGKHYQFADVAFYPKPIQQPRTPVWIGGEGAASQRRTAQYGDAWFPYFVRTTPTELRAGFERVREQAAALGRDPGAIQLTCCRPIEVTSDPAPQDAEVLRGSPEQLVEALQGYRDAGVAHLALQFMVPRWPDRVEQIALFASEVLPHVKD